MVAPSKIAIDNAGPDVSRLVESAQAGEIVLTRAGQPVAKIIAISTPQGRPKAGYGKGTVLYMADDFNAPIIPV